jgi:hypothetical protein
MFRPKNPVVLRIVCPPATFRLLFCISRGLEGPALLYGNISIVVVFALCSIVDRLLCTFCVPRVSSLLKGLWCDLFLQKEKIDVMVSSGYNI